MLSASDKDERRPSCTVRSCPALSGASAQLGRPTRIRQASYHVLAYEPRQL